MTEFAMYNANKTLISTATFNADIVSDVFPLCQFKNVGVQIVWTSLSGTVNATVAVQGSNDAMNWDNLATAVTLSGSSSNDLVLLDNCFCSYLRVVATKNNVTGGSIVVIATFKV
jgi:hypothetical protein